MRAGGLEYLKMDCQSLLGAGTLGIPQRGEKAHESDMSFEKRTVDFALASCLAGLFVYRRPLFDLSALLFLL